MRFGNWQIAPQFSQAVGYDDNVLGAPGKHGSVLIDTQGSVQTIYDSIINHVEFDADFGRFGYPDLPTQNYTNWSARGGWSHEFDPENVLGLGYSHYGLNQTPTGIDSTGVFQPIPYHVDVATVSYKAIRGPWTFVPIFDFAATQFTNSTNNNGVGNLGAAGLNRNTESGSLATFYEFAPQRNVVVVVRGTTAQYTQGQPKPNYNDLSFLGGFDFDVTGLVRFRGLVGYETRDYQNAAFQNHSSPIFEGTIIWTPTGLTTLTLSVLRRIEDANEAIQTGYTYTQAGLVVDHEYQRNILLQGRFSIQNANYIQSHTTQTLYDTGASATYVLNRNLRLSASYDFIAAQQQLPFSSNYTRNIVLLQLKVAI